MIKTKKGRGETVEMGEGNVLHPHLHNALLCQYCCWEEVEETDSPAAEMKISVGTWPSLLSI